MESTTAPITGPGAVASGNQAILSTPADAPILGDNSASILGDIDYPFEDAAPTEGTTLPPAAPVNTPGTPPTEATPPPPATTTPATVEAPADTDNPWDSLELDDAPTVASSPILSPEIASVAKLLGVEQLPPTEAEQLAALEARIQARVADEVRLATHDPIRAINDQLAMSDRDIVRAELNAHRTRFQTDSQIEGILDDLEGEEKLTQIATDIRTDKAAERETLKGNQTKVLQQQAQALIDAQKALDESLQGFTDPRGRDIGSKAKATLSHYATSGQYLDDLLNQPQEWHAQMMARLHPKIGPVYRQQEEAILKAKGATEVIKELEHQTVELGAGANAGLTDSKPVGADQFAW